MILRFEWDPAKAESNLRKHGVHFETAVQVFRDPLHLTVLDRIEGGEYRWQTIGQVCGTAILIVAHTITEPGADETSGPVERIRIISARAATPREKRMYAKG